MLLLAPFGRSAAIKLLDDSFAIPEEIRVDADNTHRDVDYFGYHKN